MTAETWSNRTDNGDYRIYLIPILRVFIVNNDVPFFRLNQRQYQLYQGAFAYACFPDDGCQATRTEIVRKAGQYFPSAVGVRKTHMGNTDAQVSSQSY